MISGKPVKSSMPRTSSPACASARAVPPGETISTPSSASPRAKSTTPRLSDTESSARRTRTAPGSVSSCCPGSECCSAMPRAQSRPRRRRPPGRTGLRHPVQRPGQRESRPETAAPHRRHSMEQQRTTDPENELAHTGDELEERIDRLDERIDESKKEASARSQENDDPFEEVAGDWEDTDDDAGGEDPEGFDDPQDDDDAGGEDPEGFDDPEADDDDEDF